MEAQPAQTPTSTTYARPQQPTEAYAATLPVETLSRIYEFALEGFLAPDEDMAQAQRIKYGLVCHSWCLAAVPLPRYIVTSSNKAERLAQLLKGHKRSGHSVRAVQVSTWSEEDSGRGRKIVKLLAQCPRLERLVLQIEGRLCAKGSIHTDGVLGKPLSQACMKLVHLRHFELISTSPLPQAVLAEFLSSWPSLTSLRLDNAGRSEGPFEIYEFETVPAHLAKLSIIASNDYDLTRALIKATSKTLRSLDVGEVPTNSGKAVIDAVTPVLPQLTSFTIADGEVTHPQHTTPRLLFLERAIKRLERVETLIIGVNGYSDPSILFALLGTLSHLRSFTLETSRYSGLMRLRQISVDLVLSFFKNAPPTLRNIGLPSAWFDSWPKRLNELGYARVESGLAVWRGA